MKQIIKIKNIEVGLNNPVFIIAEIGSNHDQNISKAKELIDVAYQSGANAVKFQLFNAKDLYKPEDDLFSVFKSIELNKEWIPELKIYAEKNGLIFFASPFDIKSIKLMDKYNIDLFKWASSETTNLKNLKLASSFGKPIIISTGMCDLSDIYEAITVCINENNKNIILLYTSSLYPTCLSDSNLLSIQKLKNIFDFPIGFSDHTLGSTAAIVSVGLGASVIEKHITLDKKLKGPDHFYAAEPEEFLRYINDIRDAESSLGSVMIDIHPSVKKIARRESIYAKNDIKKGDFINKKDVEIRRPALGINKRYISCVIGQKAKRKISKKDPILWKDI